MSDLYQQAPDGIDGDDGRIIARRNPRTTITQEHLDLAARWGACRKGLERARALLGRDFATLSESARSWAVRKAAFHGELSLLTQLFASGKVDEHNRGAALCHAADRGYIEIVELLLAGGGIDAYVRGAALQLAVCDANPELVALILSSGEVFHEDLFWCAQHAASRGYKKIVDLIGLVP